MEDKICISVILPLKLSWTPYYYAPKDEVKPGSRVRVMFCNKEYCAVVCHTRLEPPKGIRILDIKGVEHGLEDITENELRLWEFVSGYYLCDIGEVYKAAYPIAKIDSEKTAARVKDAKNLRQEKLVQSLAVRKTRLEARLLEYKDKLEKTRSGTKAYATLEERIGRVQEDIQRAEKAIDAIHEQPLSGIPSIPVPKASDIDIPQLSESQNTAFESIRTSFAGKRPVLLFGVTGSGKTEIYFRLAVETLLAGKNVLFMMPEIAMSRQMETRIEKVFGKYVSVFHSKETSVERRKIADRIRTQPYIVLGTRSALFLPHQNLGLIIVDEEQDNSYKQDSLSPRYNGRDTALMLARIHSANCILGTATPSLETMYNCKVGLLDMVMLRERYFGESHTDVRIIDTSAERRKNGMRGNFSIKLIEMIRATLREHGQILILRGRRAYAPAVQCTECGNIVTCPHCNVPLSLHKGADGKETLLCHYCGYRTAYTGKCPKCNGVTKYLGSGTQKIEEELTTLFPEARIARLDSDAAMKAGQAAAVIKAFARKETDILVGTQIITKGFDFEGIALVAVIQADSLLGQQDFRADEKAVRLLEQFKGRGGRRGQKGTFVIQTQQPEHPIFRMFGNGAQASQFELITGSYDRMLSERFSYGYPPFSRLIVLMLKDTNEARLAKLAGELKALIVSRLNIPVSFIQKSGEIAILGPYQPPVDKVSDRSILHIRLSLPKDKMLAERKETLRRAISEFEKEKKWLGHITINVDPD